jgi:threonine dehydrogenase-like Zn-dependent dehydrogenase
LIPALPGGLGEDQQPQQRWQFLSEFALPGDGGRLPSVAGQGEAVRVPYADGTLVQLPVAADSALLPSLLALSDVMTTGHHGAVTAGVGRGDTVLVVGDGAVGLCAVIAAHRLGAERIVLAGRHSARTDLGREFGATDVVAERGAEGVARIRELTGGVDTAIEAVGTRPALDTALGAIRDGGTISRLGVPREVSWRPPHGAPTMMRDWISGLSGWRNASKSAIASAMSWSISAVWRRTQKESSTLSSSAATAMRPHRMRSALAGPAPQ